MKRKFNKFNIVFIIISMIFLYKDVIYYHIPLNPIEGLYNENPEIYRSTLSLEYGDLELGRTEEYRSPIHKDILKYFAEMKMYPIKDYRHTEHIYDSEFRYVKFSIGNPHHKNLFIGFESPNIIEIHSNNMIRDGYYKIVGDGVDFIYLSNTLKKTNTGHQENSKEKILLGETNLKLGHIYTEKISWFWVMLV